jgi:hypothetical protein
MAQAGAKIGILGFYGLWFLVCDLSFLVCCPGSTTNPKPQTTNPYLACL